jgi:hypothetical protein
MVAQSRKLLLLTYLVALLSEICAEFLLFAGEAKTILCVFYDCKWKKFVGRGIKARPYQVELCQENVIF